MTADLLTLAIGLAALVGGAELLVSGASAIAKRLGISPFLVGLTVVAFGTSAPELVVAVRAALVGSPGLAIGNVVGSNIANIGLILGVSAVLRPVPSPASGHGMSVRSEVMIMLAAALAAATLLLTGGVSRIAGGVLFGGYILYIARGWRKRGAVEEEPSTEGVSSWGGAVWRVAMGIFGLAAGGEMTVMSATDIAQELGVSSTIIGLTMVAIGTSLPELATSIAAVVRKHGEIVLGNVIGSNICNVLLVLGPAGLIAPLTAPDGIAVDAVVMVLFSLACLPIVVRGAHGRRIGRIEGVVLVLAFAGYIAYNAFRSGS